MNDQLKRQHDIANAIRDDEAFLAQTAKDMIILSVKKNSDIVRNLFDLPEFLVKTLKDQKYGEPTLSITAHDLVMKLFDSENIGRLDPDYESRMARALERELEEAEDDDFSDLENDREYIDFFSSFQRANENGDFFKKICAAKDNTDQLAASVFRSFIEKKLGCFEVKNEECLLRMQEFVVDALKQQIEDTYGDNPFQEHNHIMWSPVNLEPQAMLRALKNENQKLVALLIQAHAAPSDLKHQAFRPEHRQ